MALAPIYEHEGKRFQLLHDHLSDRGVPWGKIATQRLLDEYGKLASYHSTTSALSWLHLCQDVRSETKCVQRLLTTLRDYHIETITSGNTLLHMKKSLCHICNGTGKPQMNGAHGAHGVDIMQGEVICHHIKTIRCCGELVPVFLLDAFCSTRTVPVGPKCMCNMGLCLDRNADWCDELHAIIDDEFRTTMILKSLPETQPKVSRRSVRRLQN